MQKNITGLEISFYLEIPQFLPSPSGIADFYYRPNFGLIIYLYISLYDMIDFLEKMDVEFRFFQQQSLFRIHQYYVNKMHHSYLINLLIRLEYQFS